MKRKLFLASLITITLFSCSKDEDVPQPCDTTPTSVIPPYQGHELVGTWQSVYYIVYEQNGDIDFYQTGLSWDYSYTEYGVYEALPNTNQGWLGTFSIVGTKVIHNYVDRPQSNGTIIREDTYTIDGDTLRMDRYEPNKTTYVHYRK